LARALNEISGKKPKPRDKSGSYIKKTGRERPVYLFASVRRIILLVLSMGPGLLRPNGPKTSRLVVQAKMNGLTFPYPSSKRAGMKGK